MVSSPASSTTLANLGLLHHKLELECGFVIQPKGHLEPHISNLPRRRVVRRRVVESESEDEDGDKASAKTESSHSLKDADEPHPVRIQALGENTDVCVSVAEVEGWDGDVVRVDEEEENDCGVPTSPRSTFLELVSKGSALRKVLVVGTRVNVFAVGLGILCRRSGKDMIETYMELHDTGGLEDAWRGLLSRDGVEWVAGEDN
ncbi:uncharacterized protein EV420DRAFT_1483319 [Desarmillaria tabescens]|uniref:Uncharacterized protein n=1 Tax=Armillaria tabescens TaxID=1929756 RepID=A0AA39JWU1_ARMTA|nr:uncharacterized protein EV420DRAFT_1483319 [Desarmillaria tabescens]KAK0448899.1 hypothetical protein EV420DRAFT_1483319 [Desarmillaria tabescens]